MKVSRRSMKHVTRCICTVALTLFVGGIVWAQGATQTGAVLEIKGTVSQGDAVKNIDLFITDSQIHSGAPRSSPCDEILSDSYVLQGGSPSGCDNEPGDPSFEVTQSHGQYSFTTESSPGYRLDVTTEYHYEGCNTAVTVCASPDTGFLTVTNNGLSTFTGTITLSGKSSGCGTVSDSSTGSLSPGDGPDSPGGSVTLVLPTGPPDSDYISPSDSSSCGGFSSNVTVGEIKPVAPGTTTVLLPDGPLTQSITFPASTQMGGVAKMRDVLRLVDGAVCDATVAAGNPGDTAYFGGSSIPGPPAANPRCLRVSGNDAAIITNECFDAAGNQFPDCTTINQSVPNPALIGLDSQYSSSLDPTSGAYVIAHDDDSHLIGHVPGPDWTNITKSFQPGCTTPPCGSGGGGKRLNGQETVIDLNLDCQLLAFTITPRSGAPTVPPGGLVTVAGNIRGCSPQPGSSTNGYGLLTFTFEGPHKQGGVCTQTRVSLPPPPKPGAQQGGFPVRLAPVGFNRSFSFLLPVPSNACTGLFKFSTTIKSGTVFYNNTAPLTVQ
ncbi:MAG TPA: hypothetical protein VFA76_08655 [Terriglobales bacterium]|nr:hypothetical protein [Terriglobales bacterium]